MNLRLVGDRSIYLGWNSSSFGAALRLRLEHSLKQMSAKVKQEITELKEQEFSVSAAPTTPSKLGENAKFVFALPPRWIGFVDTLGQDAAGKVPKTFRAF